MNRIEVNSRYTGKQVTFCDWTDERDKSRQLFTALINSGPWSDDLVGLLQEEMNGFALIGSKETLFEEGYRPEHSPKYKGIGGYMEGNAALALGVFVGAFCQEHGIDLTADDAMEKHGDLIREGLEELIRKDEERRARDLEEETA